MKLLLLIIVLLTGDVVWAATPAEVSGEISRPATVTEKLMGIEIETSAIKIVSPGIDKLGFIVTTPFRKNWMIEEDTSDDTFSKTPDYEPYDRNLEFKTIGGFNYAEILEVSTTMQALLHYLHEYARPNIEIDASTLSTQLKLAVIPKVATHPRIFVKSKIADRSIRPQITYQMPLSLLSTVFERLRVLNHPKIHDFLDCFNPDITELNEAKIHAQLTHSHLLMRNSAREKEVRLFLKHTVAPVIAGMPTSNAKGFCYLLLYYWYTIFNNKENALQSSEPGPKKSLAIISRVPLSQLFDKLDLPNQEMVHQVLDKIIRDHGARFRITEYSDYDEKTVRSPLTLQDWYHSVVNTAARKTVGTKSVDLLSPPPGLEDTGYSMGCLDIEKDASGSLLIEVRGYATLTPSGVAMNIDNMHTFINTEAHWFFNELEGGD